MPLTAKGEEILANYKKEYGDKKGESYFYASANKGTITGVHDGRSDADPDFRDLTHIPLSQAQWAAYRGERRDASAVAGILAHCADRLDAMTRRFDKMCADEAMPEIPQAPIYESFEGA